MGLELSDGMLGGQGQQRWLDWRMQIPRAYAADMFVR